MALGEHEIRAHAECWITHELDGEGVKRVTVWDSEPARGFGQEQPRRAVVLYGTRPDLSGNDIVEITTDSEVVAAFLDD